MTTYNSQPTRTDPGSVGAYETAAQQLLNNSYSGYQSAPNPQLINETLNTGLGSNLTGIFSQGDPSYQSILTGSPTGMPQTTPDLNSLGNSLANSVAPTSIYSYNQDQYLHDTKNNLGDDQSLVALGENPIPNVGYYNSLASMDQGRVKKYQQFLMQHGFLQQKDLTNSWDTTTAEAMREYMLARYLPEALYGSGQDKTNASQFLSGIGTPVNDIISANNHSNSDTFTKQVFMNWIATQDPQHQKDALNEYVNKYGNSSVPADIGKLAGGGGFTGSIEDSVSGFFHSLPLVGDAVAKPFDMIGNMFQISKLNRPWDIFEDTRQVRAKDFLNTLAPQDQAALAGIQQQIADSTGFLGILDDYERFRVKALYGILYNSSQLIPGSDHKFENPFDPTTPLGYQALIANGDITAGSWMPGKAGVGDTLHQLPVLGGIASFGLNMLTDPATFIGPGKALKMGGRTALVADRGVATGLHALEARGFKTFSSVLTEDGHHTWAGRQVLPYFTTPMQVLLGNKLKALMSREQVLDHLQNVGSLVDTTLDRNAEFQQSVRGLADAGPVEQGNRAAYFQLARQLDQITALDPGSREMQDLLKEMRLKYGIAVPPTPQMLDWHIMTQDGTVELDQMTDMSEAEKQRHFNMVQNEFADQPYPQTLPDSMLTARTSAALDPKIQEPLHAYYSAVFRQAHDVGDGVRYSDPKAPTDIVPEEDIQKARDNIKWMQDDINHLNSEKAKPGADQAFYDRELDARSKKLRQFKKDLGELQRKRGYTTASEEVPTDIQKQFYKSMTGSTETPTHGIYNIDETLKKFRKQVFGDIRDENAPLYNEERRLLIQLMDRKTELEQATHDARTDAERLSDMQKEYKRRVSEYSKWAHAQIVAERNLPGANMHPALLDAQGYIQRAHDNFKDQVIHVDAMEHAKEAVKVKAAEARAATSTSDHPDGVYILSHEGPAANVWVRNGVVVGSNTHQALIGQDLDTLLESLYIDKFHPSQIAPISERYDPDKGLAPRPGALNAVYVGRVPKYGKVEWGNTAANADRIATDMVNQARAAGQLPGEAEYFQEIKDQVMSKLPPVPKGMTRLYRGEIIIGDEGEFERNDRFAMSDQELGQYNGRWFHSQLDSALGYIYGEGDHARLRYVDIPEQARLGYQATPVMDEGFKVEGDPNLSAEYLFIKDALDKGWNKLSANQKEILQSKLQEESYDWHGRPYYEDLDAATFERRARSYLTGLAAEGEHQRVFTQRHNREHILPPSLVNDAPTIEIPTPQGFTYGYYRDAALRQSLEKYLHMVTSSPEMMSKVKELRGKTMAVHNPGEMNEGSLLLQLAEDAYNRTDVNPGETRLQITGDRYWGQPTGEYTVPAELEAEFSVLHDWKTKNPGSSGYYAALAHVREKFSAMFPNEGSIVDVKQGRGGTYKVVVNRPNWRKDRATMLAYLKRALKNGDTLIHGDAQGADRMAADIANNELKHMGLQVKAEPADWYPESRRELAPVTGKERKQRAGFDPTGKEYVGKLSYLQYKYLNEISLLHGWDGAEDPYKFLSRVLADKKGAAAQELMSTAGRPIKISEDARVNAALERVRRDLLGKEYNTRARRAMMDPGAGVKRNQAMLDKYHPTRAYSFHHNLDLSRGTYDMVKRIQAAGVPHVHVDGPPDHAELARNATAVKRAAVNALHERRLARFNQDVTEQYKAEQKNRALEAYHQRSQPVSPEPKPTRAAHDAQVQDVTRQLGLAERMDNWHVRLQQMAQVLAHPDIGAHEIFRILNLPEDSAGIDLANEIKAMKDPNKIMERLAQEHAQSYVWLDPKAFAQFEQMLKGLEAVKQGRASTSRTIRWLNAAGTQMTNGDISLIDRPYEAATKVQLLLSAVGVDAKQIAQLSSNIMLTKDPAGRTQLLNEGLYPMLQQYFDTDPVFKRLGGWDKFNEWKWNSRTKGGALKAKTVGYALKPDEQGNLREMSQGPQSTGNPVKDEEVRSARLALSTFDEHMRALVARMTADRMHTTQRATTWDYKSAEKSVLEQQDKLEEGDTRTFQERMDSQREALVQAISEATGGLDADRPVPAIESQLAWKASLPMTPYEAIVYRHSVLRNSEAIQDKIRASWMSTRWKQVVLTNLSTSTRITLGDEISRFVLTLASEGHYIAAAKYVADNLQQYASTPVKAGVRGLARVTGKEAPKWASKATIDPQVLTAMAGFFHLLSDHSVAAFTPDAANFDKAIQRMFNTTLRNSKVARDWAQAFHRDFDIRQKLLDAETAHAAEDYDTAYEHLQAAQDMLNSRPDLIAARDSFQAVMGDYLGDQTEMQQAGTLFTQTAAMPDFSGIKRMLKDEPKNEDLIKELSNAKLDVPKIRQMMEERGLDSEKANFEQLLTQTKLHTVAPRLNLADVKAGLQLALKKQAIDKLVEMINTPMVREGDRIPDKEDPTKFTIATKDDEAFAKQMREMRRVNRIYLKNSGWADETANDYASTAQDWYRDRYHQLSAKLAEMDRRGAKDVEYSALEKRTSEDWGFSIKRDTDEFGQPLKKLGPPAPGKMRVYRVVGGNRDEVFTELPKAQDAAGATMGNELEYVDVPAHIAKQYEADQWRMRSFGDVNQTPASTQHVLHDEAAKTGWGPFNDTGTRHYGIWKARAYATAREFRNKARALEQETGRSDFYAKRAQDWAENTHQILSYWTEHPVLAKALYSGEDLDMKAVRSILARQRYAEMKTLPSIVQPIQTLDGARHGTFPGKVNDALNWYHENITQAMVNYARGTGVARLAKVYAHDVANAIGKSASDPAVLRVAHAKAIHWMHDNTYQGQRSILGHAVRNVFPFWGATSNMARFWAGLLSDPIRIAGRDTGVYPAMPALNAMNSLGSNSQQGGIRIPIPLTGFMQALHMGSGDEMTIDPAHMFFFTSDGIASFQPSFGPMLSYGLDAAASVDPHLVDAISSWPVVGPQYAQYINTQGFNPLLGWGSTLLSGITEAATGKLPNETPLGWVPGLVSPGTSEEHKVLTKERSDASAALQQGRDTGTPTDLPDPSQAVSETGAGNIFQGLLRGIFPVLPTVADKKSTEVTNALKAWDSASDDASKDKVIADNPDVADLLKYFDTRTSTDQKDQIALDHPWVVPFATSIYNRPEGPTFTASANDFHQKLQAGDINMENPQAYLDKVKLNVQYNQAETQYALLKGQEEEFLRETGAASTSAIAKTWRQNYYYPMLDKIANEAPDWANTFIRQPGYDQFSKYVESLPLRALLGWEVLPQADNLSTSTTNLWRQVLADVQQTATGLSDMQNNGGTKIDEQNLMQALDNRLQGYASQDPQVADVLRRYHFGRVEDLVQAAGVAPLPGS